MYVTETYNNYHKLIRAETRQTLTAEYHHTDREDLLVLAVGRHIPESDARHAGQCEVKRRRIGHRVLGASLPDHSLTARRVSLSPRLLVTHAYLPSEALKPTVLDSLRCLGVSDREPEAGEPVSDQNEHDDEQYEHRCSVLHVVVQLTSYATQTKEADDFQGTEQTAHVLVNSYTN